jgi:dihydrofolate reductase
MEEIMRKLVVFNQVSLDGYFTDAKGDMSWAHKQDKEWNEFVTNNAKGGGELLFGRITYDMMKSFWPTPAAAESFPVVAEQMNNLQKIVFSRTLKEATWNNARLVNGDIAEEVRKLKDEAGDQMVIMGSGTIISQLASAGLIDEYQIVVNPIVLGAGRTMFEDVKERLSLKRTNSRTFSNGNVLLCYES